MADDVSMHCCEQRRRITGLGGVDIEVAIGANSGAEWPMDVSAEAIGWTICKGGRLSHPSKPV